MSTAWLTGAVAAADAALQSLGLLTYVTHEAWIGQDGYGKPMYAVAVSLKALVQEGAQPHRRGADGDAITTRACVSFREAVPVNGAAGRREPIDPRDRITLSSGFTGPLVQSNGSVVNPDTGAPFSGSVWLR